MENYSFDLIRIFFGQTPPIIYFEIIVRTITLFLYVVFLLRITPQRNIGELSPLDLLIVIALGSAVGDPMFYPEVPVLHGIAVITVIFILNYFLAKVATMNSHIESTIQGKPKPLLINGVLQIENMRQANITREDFFMEMRLNQYDKLGQIKRAYVETNGRISLLPFDDDQVISPSVSVIPPRDLLKLAPLGRDIEAQHEGNHVCYSCGYVKNFDDGQLLGTCPNCGLDHWYYFEDLERAADNLNA